MPWDAVVLCGEIVLLRAAGIIFLIVIGFSEVVWAIVWGTGCGGHFHGFSGSFNVVGGNLKRRFCWVVGVPVFLYGFQGVAEVVNRFPGVVSSLGAFPVDQEFVPVVLLGGSRVSALLPILVHSQLGSVLACPFCGT